MILTADHVRIFIQAIPHFCGLATFAYPRVVKNVESAIYGFPV